MLNTIDSNVNFKGGFRFKNMPVEAREKLPAYFTKHRQIFDNFENKGDVFLTVRKGSDIKVCQFIEENNLNFEYYSKIDTKSGLDNERHDGLTALIKKNGEKPIKSLQELKKILFKYKDAQKPIDENIVENILKPLCMDLDKKTISLRKNLTVVEDKEFARKVFISPQSKYGVHYVMVKPDSLTQFVERYAITPEGEIISRYTSPEGIRNFNKQIEAIMSL